MNEDRTARLSFSSEIEASRWFGGEILDHQPASVRMGFMGSGNAPLLLHHDQRQLVGVVTSAGLGGGRGHATVRFGRGGLAERARQDVEDGILRNVSVGYRVHKMTLDREEGDREVFRVNDWEPLEASLVSIPVDPTVGVGRSVPNESEELTEELNNPLGERVMTTETIAAPAAPEVRLELIGDSARSARDERSRIREIQSLAARHNLGNIGEEAVDRGVSIEAFRGTVLGELDKRGSSKPLQAVPGDLELTSRERKAFSLSRAILGMADGMVNNKRFSGFEREASDEIAKRLGKEAQGMFLPYDLLGERGVEGGAPSMFNRTMTSSVSTAAGGALVQSTVLAGQYVPPNYNIPIVVKAGARVLSGLQGNILIPAMTAGKSVTWASSENVAITAADPTFAQISLSPKDMGAVADISRRLLLQANPAIDGLVRDDLAVAIANGIDVAALNGSGASGQPAGLLGNASIGIQAGGTNGLALTWANLTYLPQLVGAANRIVDGAPMAFITNQQVFSHAARTVKVSGYPTFLAQYEENLRQGLGVGGGTMMGYPVHISQNIPSNLTKGSGTALSAAIFGNWSDLMIGEWGVLDMLVDPYTLSNTGGIRVRAFMTVDMNVRYAGSFSTIKDIITT